MVVKKCPECDQTLPVACKSCPCGHIFISRKQLMPEKTETEVFNRERRLRPEVPKREIQDFDYRFSASEPTSASDASKTSEQIVSIKVPIPSGDGGGAHVIAVGAPVPSLSDLRLPEEYLSINGKRKRGRPKGSKNKPKPNLLSNGVVPQENANAQILGDPTKRRRGRPKGSKNKPKDPSMFAGTSQDGWSSDHQDYFYREPLDVMPHISKEKAVTYSIVLSDINQKMLKQSSMNFV